MASDLHGVSTSLLQSDSDFLWMLKQDLALLKNKLWIYEDCGGDSRGNQGRGQRPTICVDFIVFCRGEKHACKSPRHVDAMSAARSYYVSLSMSDHEVVRGFDAWNT